MKYSTKAHQIVDEWKNDEFYTEEEKREGIQEDIDELNKETLQNLFDMINSGWKDHIPKTTIEVWNGTHRTLQQGFFREFIIPLIKHISELDEVYFDARNEDTKKLCDVIMEKCKDDLYMRFI